MSTTDTTPHTLVTVRKLHEQYRDALTVPAIRDHIWRAVPRTLPDGRELPANGLAPAILRIGKKILIDRDLYAAWLESHRLAPLAEIQRDRAA